MLSGSPLVPDLIRHLVQQAPTRLGLPDSTTQVYSTVNAVHLLNIYDSAPPRAT
ncbi:hypothetical protein HUO14_02250 [Parasphingorhabdus flavimaris]|jgi:site-specific recombinase XerC|uniref:Uncharacterized protein n=1 Tax=Parasphingorhabdus flavimaris TaxID=266812 RepID=A0ABX2MZ49_9SPHN|nr:hypothetical protein [Parasphingorhabdus flavimaris]NVD26725.1 hypothetical protein [Parasphingorhabdus flavimaris]|tara:strand:- start:10726 stop:10887 length:162 start_codon:yes stop_codon:yes gene_type:complete